MFCTSAFLLTSLRMVAAWLLTAATTTDKTAVGIVIAEAAAPRPLFNGHTTAAFIFPTVLPLALLARPLSARANQGMVDTLIAMAMALGASSGRTQ